MELVAEATPSTAYFNFNPIMDYVTAIVEAVASRRLGAGVSEVFLKVDDGRIAFFMVTSMSKAMRLYYVGEATEKTVEGLEWSKPPEERVPLPLYIARRIAETVWAMNIAD